ncbi:MAG TPA: carboxypeptidase regulatory-like domain-containing protein [Terracidiphilus sp.]|nr:carboxypeptidase regulatory-like domain-containing protein [Terracidiphilus sp.]
MQTNENKNLTKGSWGHKLTNAAAAAWCCAAVFVLALCAAPAHAQYGASLQGTVTDPTGALVPGATLTLNDKETGRTLTTHSSDSGTFVFSALGPSNYTLVITRDGFKKKSIDNVKILPDQSNGMNVVLEVGAATESVTVNANTQPIIDTENGQVGAAISQNEIAKLPSFGRDVFQLVQLAPGMFGDGSQSGGGGTDNLPGNQGDGGTGATSGVFQTENKPQVFANGGRNDTNGISLDGVGITSVTWGSAAIVTPSEDSIKAVNIVSSGYDAQWGGTSGGQVQVTSENGTNTFHGSAFIKIDRPGLNAYQRWDPNNNPQRNNSRFNQMGGTLGGPIIHNKLFGFFSYETIRNTSTSTGGGWYDTASFDGSSSTSSIANKFLTLKGAGASYSKILEDPADNHDCASINLVQGVNCNWIQGQGLDLGRPLTSPLGTQDPSWAPQNSGVYTPGLGGDGTGSYATNMDGNADMMFVATVAPNDNINQQFNGRVDFQATQNDLIAATLYYVPVNNTSYNGPSRASNLFYHNAKNYSTGLLYNHIFSPTMLNEARADLAGWKWNELTSNPQSPLGLPDDSANQFSSQSIGFGPSIGSVFDQWTFNVRDVLTKVISAHSLKIGGQFTRLAYLDEPTWFAQPSYGFNNLWDFVNDAPFSESITADPRTGKPSAFTKNTRGNQLAFFAQDDWKARPNLTINAGLRWEDFGGMTEKQGHLANLRLGSGANTLTGIKFVLGSAEFTTPKYNFGPQLGFAWSPDQSSGKLVVRGGFGIGYNGLEFAITTNTRNNPPYLANGGFLTGSQIVYGTASDVYQFGALPANPNMITDFDANNLPTANVQLSVTGLPANLATAYVYRYSLEGQYNLGDHWVGTLGYNGTMGRHLPLQYNLNNTLAPQVIAGQMTYNPKLNFIDWYADTGSSDYNALMAELEHQFAHGFQVDAQYRWGKSMDDGSGPYTNPDYMFLTNYNWGPSDFDSRNMFKLWGLWTPILFHGNSLLEKAVGGWTFSGIMNLHSGFPFNPTYNSNCSVTENYGGCQTSYRPAKYLGGAGTSYGTDAFKQPRGNFPNAGSTYFNMPVQPVGTQWPSDGTAPTPGPLPSVPGVGRNAFTGPRYSDTDFTVTKAFGLPNMRVLGENARLEIRANAYNLFNQLNLSGVDTGITDTYFGGARGVLGSRTIELEAHFKF